MKKYKVFLAIFTCFLCLEVFYACTYFDKSNSIVSKKEMQPRLILVSNSDTQTVARETIPAVVAICSFDGYNQNIGSGVTIAPNGMILTNFHVIENAKNIKLYLADGTITTANVIWKDSHLDLAILRTETNLPYLKIAPSGTYNLGEEVIAIGTPIDLNFKHTITKGVISAIDRTIQVESSDKYSTLSNLLQHDASINPGNSGGPLINLKGEVIGINTVKVNDAEGMGFAIVCDTISPVIENLTKKGIHTNGSIGVFGYDISLEEFGSKNYGIRIVDIKSDSPLREFEINKNDVITKINGNKITSFLSLKKTLLSMDKGENIQMEILKNGEIKIINFNLI